MKKNIIGLFLAVVLIIGTGTTVVLKPIDITGLLNLKANLASPALTGTPTAPTAAAGNNSTQVATTAYFDSKQQYVIQASDVSTFSTSMGDVSGMNFTVEANKNYRFEFSGRLGGTSTQGGRITLTCPTGATIEYVVIGNLGGSANSFDARGLNGSGTESPTFASAASTNSFYMYQIVGSIKVGSTAGAVQLRARSINTSNTFTVYAGGTIEAIKIN